MGLLAAGLILVLRLISWWLTGSLAVLADTLDPLLNMAAASLTLIGVLGARRPADETHPYGHRALEHLVVGVQGALALTGVGVVGVAACYQLRSGQPVTPTAAAAVLFALSLGANAVVARRQRAAGQACGSPAMVASADHARIDVLVGVGVLANLLLAGVYRLIWLDLAVSALVVYLVLRHALGLLRRAALGLLDTAPAQAHSRATSALRGLVGTELLGHHDVRCRDAGGYTFVDFHVQFAEGTSLERAHLLAEDAEDAVEQAVGFCDATAHIETHAQVRDDRDHEPPASGPEERGRRRAAKISLTIAALLMAVKLTAALVTGSAAVLSDALESIVNVLGASFAIYSISLARSGSDRSHPFGHQKIEFLAAGFEGSLIGLAGVLIMIAAGSRLVSGAQVENLGSGLALVVVATVVNGLLGLFLVRQGKLLGSLTLVADGHHVLTDVYTSFGVLGGLVVVMVTGWQLADPIVAIIVACGILYTASQLVRKSLHGVMDSVDPETLESARAVLRAAESAEHIAGWHRLRVRDVGERRFIDAHAQFADGTSLDQAHEVSERLEALLAEALAPADATIHAEPASDLLDPVGESQS
ncbi:MAG: cation diffusion facilitator family transporter [Armatimonadetes bacterium]|nr:cation diffusion facilitator family transporter [Armatimonadota bacterium]